ncbi:MAG: tetratricopeptide repeat protein [Candidatus Omnitrophota bacterium]|nr:MAG: tetratricopeptide repeat protein [Candidatus Omnitrophota bacterium]
MKFNEISLIIIVTSVVFLVSCEVSYKKKAERYLKRGKHDEAIEMYRKAILDDSNDPDTHCGLGKAYVKKAERAYIKGLFSRTSSWQTEKDINETGIYDEAIKEFERTLELDPSNIDARAQLGGLYCLKERHEEAISLLEEAIRREPNHAEAHLYLGLNLGYRNMFDRSESKFNDLVRGIKEIEKALELDPNLRRVMGVREQLQSFKHSKQTLEEYLKMKVRLDGTGWRR